jgi:hypothetical protein
LKGITTEKLFIISIARAYLDSIIYLALKKRKLNTLFILLSIARINFYFVLVYYASFYFFSKHIANSKIIKLKRKKYLARYMGDAPPPS